MKGNGLIVIALAILLVILWHVAGWPIPSTP